MSEISYYKLFFIAFIIGSYIGAIEEVNGFLIIFLLENMHTYHCHTYEFIFNRLSHCVNLAFSSSNKFIIQLVLLNALVLFECGLVGIYICSFVILDLFGSVFLAIYCATPNSINKTTFHRIILERVFIVNTFLLSRF